MMKITRRFRKRVRIFRSGPAIRPSRIITLDLPTKTTGRAPFPDKRPATDGWRNVCYRLIKAELAARSRVLVERFIFDQIVSSNGWARPRNLKTCR